MNRKWYEIRSSAGQVDVLIYDEIGLWGIRAEDFRREMSAAARDAERINVRITSPGGDVFDGIAMYHAIAEHRDRVTIEVDGVAASIASIIALAGSKLVMHEGTFYMIHDPWGIAVGTADDMRSRAGTLDAIADEMVGIYERHSNLSRDEIVAAMQAETWYTPDQAYQAGFADEIDVADDERLAAAAFDWRAYGYRHVPTPLWEMRRRARAPQTERELEQSLIAMGYSNRDAEWIAHRAFDFDAGEPQAKHQQGEPADTQYTEIFQALQTRSLELQEEN